MKQLIILVGAILVSTCGFADTQSSSLTAGSSRFNELGSAWKAHEMTHSIQSQNNINMVYGGADISRKPTIVSRTTTA